MDDDAQKRCADVLVQGTPPEQQWPATGTPIVFSIEDSGGEASDCSLALRPAIADALRKTRIGLQRELSASVAQAVDGHVAGVVAALSTCIARMEERQRRMEETDAHVHQAR